MVKTIALGLVGGIVPFLISVLLKVSVLEVLNTMILLGIFIVLEDIANNMKPGSGD